MSLKDRLGRVPPGVRDLLPPEARAKREMEDKLVRLVRSWGYLEVDTPVYEYYENLLVQETRQPDKLFKFLDRSGDVLALRPDMTRPIARLAATRLKDVPPPLRLFYTGQAFSYEEPQVGRQREFYQAGIEILGDDSADADAEAVVLAVKMLQEAGVRGFQISLGHVGVFHGLAEDLGLPAEQVEALQQAIGNKDFVLLRELLERFAVSPSDRTRVLKFLSLRGGEEALAKARNLAGSGRAKQALANTGEIFAALKAYEVDCQVTLDFGLLRQLDYYTGLVFEGYTGELGSPLCGGGRYNQLLGRFGRDLPATGFALGLEKVLLVLERQGLLEGEVAGPDCLIIYSPAKRAEAARRAGQLRAGGYTVISEVLSPLNTGGTVSPETRAGEIIVLK